MGLYLTLVTHSYVCNKYFLTPTWIFGLLSNFESNAIVKLSKNCKTTIVRILAWATTDKNRNKQLTQQSFHERFTRASRRRFLQSVSETNGCTCCRKSDRKVKVKTEFTDSRKSWDRYRTMLNSSYVVKNERNSE